MWSDDSKNENKDLSFWPYLWSERVKVHAERRSSGNNLLPILLTKSLFTLNAFVSYVSFMDLFKLTSDIVFLNFFEMCEEAKNNSCSTGSLNVISLYLPLTFFHSCCWFLFSE